MGLLLASVLGYAIGAAPLVLLLARVRGLDLRLLGTGNVGGGNLWRQAGPLLGLAGVLADVGKGIAAPLAARLLDLGTAAEALAALATAAGQMWPVTLRFRGGRGNATATGALLALSPIATVGSFAVFLLLIAQTLRSRLTRRQMGPGSVTVPLAVLGAFLVYPPLALVLDRGAAALTGLAMIALLLLRRATAPWPPDPATGRPPHRSLLPTLLLDRPDWRLTDTKVSPG